MATVYAAQDDLLGRPVAVKVLAEALGADESARSRFTREARAAARVSDHPNVVTIYDVGETETDPPLAFIVMELLSGGTVDDRIKARQPIPHRLVLSWLEQAAAALDTAHAADIVHRDVKPANLLLDANGDLKVADFGIATLGTEARLTMTGQVIGTAAYFSPEQALGHPATAASDRYALAVVAFELLTGTRPFPDAAPAAQARAHIDADPPRASDIARGLPGTVDVVLARGLAKAPEDRPESAAALVAGLRRAMGPTTAVTEVAPRFDRAPVAGSPSPVAAGQAPAAAGPVTGRPFGRGAHPPPDPHAARATRGVALAVVALLLVAGVVAAVLSTGGDSKSPESRSFDATARPRSRSRRPARSTATPAAAAPSDSVRRPSAPVRRAGMP